MAISRRVLARSIASKLIDGADAQVLIPQLAAYIVDQKLVNHVEEIIQDIAYEISRRGVLDITVTTARPLTDDLRRLVKEFVSQQQQVDTIEFTETVDESIVGGIVIETPDKRFDASVASRIKQLKMS
ncbi:MAG: F0F1 ATP synthase subunit delta [Candidatus Saccharimonadales bacterium]